MIYPEKRILAHHRVSVRRRVVDAAECAPRSANGGMKPVSIRRRVVDAAECGRGCPKSPPHSVFQSAAASWTRRNAMTGSYVPKLLTCFNPPPRRGRGGMFSDHPPPTESTSFNPPPRRGRGGMPAQCIELVVHRRFNPPPRRGRGGILGTEFLRYIGRVSIRRRVVDAAECPCRPQCVAGGKRCFNPPPRRGRGGMTCAPQRPQPTKVSIR